MLMVGAALVAASTASSVPAPEPVVALEVPPSPPESHGAGGNTPPVAPVWPDQVLTSDRIVHEVPGPYGTSGVPATVLAAYRRAFERTKFVRPGCRLPLELLAAIGKVESGHARGGQVSPDGTTTQPILGPVLNGAGPFAAIGDTDGGTLDGDAVWDRAVGPMQFIPGTWARWQADGNVDGRPDPHNVYDASLAAARYLCAANRDLGTPDGLDAAILSYNRSGSYLSLVRSWMVVYRDGAISIADITGAGVVALPAPASGRLVGAPRGRPPSTGTPPSGSPQKGEPPGRPPNGAPPDSAPPDGTPPTCDPSTGTPPDDGPPTGTPPDDDPSDSAPPDSDPPGGTSPDGGPSDGASPTDSSPTETPPSGGPPTGSPSTGSPSTSTPPNCTPSNGPPTTSPDGSPPTSTPPTGTPPRSSPPDGTPPTGNPPTSAPPSSSTPSGTPPTDAPPSGSPSAGSAPPPRTAPPTEEPPSTTQPPARDPSPSCVIGLLGLEILC